MVFVIYSISLLARSCRFVNANSAPGPLAAQGNGQAQPSAEADQ